MALLLFLLVCSVTIAVRGEGVDTSQIDCNETPDFCQHGSCKADGFCQCVRGFRGASCASFPPHLERGWKIPGQVEEDNTEAFYTINEGEFSTTTVIDVLVVGGGSPINVYASIGILPTKEISQWKFENSQKVELAIDSTELAENALPTARKVLFVVIQAANDPKDKIAFAITNRGGGIIGGLEDWVFGLIVGLAICCCCVIICIIIFVVVCRGGDDKQNNYHNNGNFSDAQSFKQNNNSGGTFEMQQGYSMGGPGGYPSGGTMNNGGGGMNNGGMNNGGMNNPNNPYGGAQSSYPSNMGGGGGNDDMQAGYNLGGADARPSGYYDNNSSVGGYSSENTMLQRGGEDTMLQRGGGGFAGGGFDNGFNTFDGNNFGGDTGGYQMDQNTQALW